MPILDIGNIYICSWSKEFGIVLIPEVEFTSISDSFRVSFSSNLKKQIFLSSSTPCNVDMGSACPMLQAISISLQCEGLGHTTNWKPIPICSNFLKL